MESRNFIVIGKKKKKHIMDGQITNEHGRQGQYENGIKHGGPESKF